MQGHQAYRLSIIEGRKRLKMKRKKKTHAGCFNATQLPWVLWLRVKGETLRFASLDRIFALLDRMFTAQHKAAKDHWLERSH